MGNADTAKEKFEGFISKTEDFNRLMNFLEAIHKLTYNSGSGNDPCTAYYYRNLLNLRNVKGKQFFFENNEDICHAVREVLSNPEHEVNYWNANLEDGHVKCHFCARTYAYVGSLKSHEMKVNGVQMKKEKKEATVKDQDQLQDYILMLFNKH
ncbi:unnamed protein product [Mytilus coruscus]|uniref:Uncharacterized protein n=1 Tax=Mytilus coruscus TaxID=42192 RepID=A0A6J8A0B0_MYTCO|nr:unnamed protein product [Mytilus coruscus]